MANTNYCVHVNVPHITAQLVAYISRKMRTFSCTRNSLRTCLFLLFAALRCNFNWNAAAETNSITHTTRQCAEACAGMSVQMLVNVRWKNAALMQAYIESFCTEARAQLVDVFGAHVSRLLRSLQTTNFNWTPIRLMFAPVRTSFTKCIRARCAPETLLPNHIYG